MLEKIQGAGLLLDKRKTASSRTRGGVGGTLEEIASLKGFSESGTGSPGRWTIPHPWRCSEEADVVLSDLVQHQTG